MKNAWIAYVLMTTASSSATTTKIGNSRQNDRFLRGRLPRRPPPIPDPAPPIPPTPPPGTPQDSRTGTSRTDTTGRTGTSRTGISLAAGLGLRGRIMRPPPADPDAPDPSSALTGWL